jgi:hypothetical protein
MGRVGQGVVDEKVGRPTAPTPVAQATHPIAVATLPPASTPQSALLTNSTPYPGSVSAYMRCQEQSFTPVLVEALRGKTLSAMSLNEIVWYSSPPVSPVDWSTPC